MLNQLIEIRDKLEILNNLLKQGPYLQKYRNAGSDMTEGIHGLVSDIIKSEIDVSNLMCPECHKKLIEDPIYHFYSCDLCEGSYSYEFLNGYWTKAKSEIIESILDIVDADGSEVVDADLDDANYESWHDTDDASYAFRA